MKWTPRTLKLGFNLFFGPYIGAGVKVTRIDPRWRGFDVRMKLRWYNRNYFGTHFGGSLYSMVDPHFVLMLANLLGRDYIVWDKAATIEFVRPGRGTMYASLRVDDADLDDIRKKTAGGTPYLPVKTIEVKDANGEVVARITKTLYIRRKTG